MQDHVDHGGEAHNSSEELSLSDGRILMTVETSVDVEGN
jgi:hypothetical protein